MKKFEGLIAAPFTGFHPDGSLNLDVIERQAEHLIGNGVRGVFVCGTTGESSSLTLDERRSVAARWVDVADENLVVIVHTGHNCLADARSLAVHARDIGAAAMGATMPCYFKPARIVDLVDCCEELASAAPDLPLYYYHIPHLTGLNFSMAAFLEAAADRVSNLAGVKFTHENLMDYARAMSVCDGRYDMLFGRDEILLSSLVLGSRGAVGSTYNYSSRTYLNVMSAFAAGRLDEARQWQSDAVTYISLMARYGGLPAAKVIMDMVGVDCGPVRLPLRNLSREQRSQLREELELSGFFEAVELPATKAPARLATMYNG